MKALLIVMNRNFDESTAFERIKDSLKDVAQAKTVERLSGEYNLFVVDSSIDFVNEPMEFADIILEPIRDLGIDVRVCDKIT